MTFSSRNFDHLTPLAPKLSNFAIQILLFRLKHTVAVVTHAHVLQNFYTTWVRGVACQKQRLGPKLEGGWARVASRTFGTSYVFLQPLKLPTSNLKFGTQLGFGASLPKNVRHASARLASFIDQFIASLDQYQAYKLLAGQFGCFGCLYCIFNPKAFTVSHLVSPN